jgi:ATP-dependent Clp protease protease subunit
VYDYISMMKAPVRTVCIGTAASMGAILFLAGRKRQMLPHTRLMIHDPSYSHNDIGGCKPHEIQHELDKLNETRAALAEIIAEKTGKTLEEISLEEYKAVSDLFDADLYEEISLETCVGKRISAGGTGPESVKAQIESIREFLKA